MVNEPRFRTASGQHTTNHSTCYEIDTSLFGMPPPLNQHPEAEPISHLLPIRFPAGQIE